MLKYIIKCFLFTWLGSVIIGLIYGACTVREISPKNLWIMGVVHISIIIASIISVIFTPLTAIALRKDISFVKWLVPLLVLLAGFCIFVTLINSSIGLLATIMAGMGGLVVIGLLIRP